MTGKSDIVDIEAELCIETAEAFQIYDGAAKVWVPKSPVEHDPTGGTFAMPSWLAQDRGLI